MRRFTIVRTPFPQYIRTNEEADEYVEKVFATPEIEAYGIGFDTETSGLNTIRDRVHFFSVATLDSRICAPARLLSRFEPLLADTEIPKVATNAKFDTHMAMNMGVHIRGPILDTITMDWLLDENARHGLKETAKRHLGLTMTPFSKLFGKVRSIQAEIDTVREVQQILEMYDYRKRHKEARDKALNLLVRLNRAQTPVAQKALNTVALARNGASTDIKKILTIARATESTTKNGGKYGYVKDAAWLVAEEDLSDAPKDYLLEWEEVVNSDTFLEMAVEALWHRLIKRISNKNPVEELRTIIEDYASLDAWASLALTHNYYFDALDDEEMLPFGERPEEPISLLDFYYNERVDFGTTLFCMERRGVKVDLATCRDFADELTKSIEELEKEAVAITGDLDFNPNSSQQLQRYFFDYDESTEKWYDVEGNLATKLTPGGTPSVDKTALETFALRGEELASTILGLRAASKLKSTYADVLLEKSDENDRIHTTYRGEGTVTARLSSADPNLQNIPVRSEQGVRVRKMFIAGYWGDCSPDICLDMMLDVPVPDLPPDFPMRLIVADYEQVEMRIMAHVSQDENMIAAIRDGKDLHCFTVALACARGIIRGGYSYEDIEEAKKAENPTEEQKWLVGQRAGLKATGFGILYGIGALKLGMQLGMPIVSSRSRNGRVYDNCPQAEQLINDYLNEIYPKVGKFIRATHEQCMETLEVRTLQGRARRLYDAASTKKHLKARALRQSVNSIVQGTAADITNAAMLKCERDKKLRRLGVRQLLQIHDEIVYEVPDLPEFYEPASKRIIRNLESVVSLSVPITASIDNAYSWGEAK